MECGRWTTRRNWPGRFPATRSSARVASSSASARRRFSPSRCAASAMIARRDGLGDRYPTVLALAQACAPEQASRDRRRHGARAGNRRRSRAVIDARPKRRRRASLLTVNDIDAARTVARPGRVQQGPVQYRGRDRPLVAWDVRPHHFAHGVRTCAQRAARLGQCPRCCWLRAIASRPRFTRPLYAPPFVDQPPASGRC